MEERKGLLTAEQESFLADVLDNVFKFKNGFIEKIDGILFKQLVKVADNFGADKIPETWKNEIIPIIDAAILNEKEKVRGLVVDLLNKKIDIPKLDDEQELIVFDSFSRFVAVSIDFFINKKAG